MDHVGNVSNNHLQPMAALKNNRGIDRDKFQDTLKSLISRVDGQLKEADQKTEDFAVGKQHSLHEVMIATEKADLSFRFLLQIRNKLLDAYQEIMRMNF